MPYLPKQRGKQAFRLSKEDLAPRRVSTNAQDFDFGPAIESYSPQKYSSTEIPHIPVYNRDKNTIRRFSRIGSSGASASHLSSPAENRAASQAINANKELSLKQLDISTDALYDIQQLEISGKRDENAEKTISIGQVQPLEPRAPQPKRYFSSEMPIETERRESTLSTRGALRIHEWINRRSSPPLDDASEDEDEDKRYERYERYERKITQTRNVSEELKNDGPDFDKESPNLSPGLSLTKSAKEFPRFVPQFQPQLRTVSTSRSQTTARLINERVPNNEISESKTNTNTSSPGTSASSRMSAFESQCSVKSYVSSETEASSVEMYMPEDVSDIHGKRTESGSESINVRKDESNFEYIPKHFLDDEPEGNLDKKIEGNFYQPPMNSLQKQCIVETPPEPPRHEHTIYTREKQNLPSRQNPKRFSTSSIDFCLDLGADYDKSRFMIPPEHQLPRFRVSRRRHEVPMQKGNEDSDFPSFPKQNARRSVVNMDKLFSRA